MAHHPGPPVCNDQCAADDILQKHPNLLVPKTVSLLHAGKPVNESRYVTDGNRAVKVHVGK
jgi:hypothetical protein